MLLDKEARHTNQHILNPESSHTDDWLKGGTRRSIPVPVRSTDSVRVLYRVKVRVRVPEVGEP